MDERFDDDRVTVRGESGYAVPVLAATHRRRAARDAAKKRRVDRIKRAQDEAQRRLDEEHRRAAEWYDLDPPSTDPAVALSA